MGLIFIAIFLAPMLIFNAWKDFSYFKCDKCRKTKRGYSMYDGKICEDCKTMNYYE